MSDSTLSRSLPEDARPSPQHQTDTFAGRDLDELAARTAAALSTGAVTPRWALAAEIPALLAEVRRLRAIVAVDRDCGADDVCALSDRYLAQHGRRPSLA